MARIHEKLGFWVLARELVDIGLENTRLYDPYEDETEHEHTFPQLAEMLEPTPEVEDDYIGTGMLLPRGDQMARSHVWHSITMSVKMLWVEPM